MPRHTLHFEREMDKLKKMVLTMGTTVEENVQRGVNSILNRDASLGLKVIASDEKVNDLEVDIEEDCLKILALHQPVANDLRLVVAILKINNDLERIGDLAVNIAERGVFLATEKEIEIPENFEKMSKISQGMVKKSLDSLIREDSQQARNVCLEDDEVDEMNRDMFKRIGSKIEDNLKQLDSYIQLLSASRYLERVADHATNIAEDVIYMVEGKIIRHKKGLLESGTD